ncbi:MAG: hypothetical protein KDE27_15760 [Planctomycetes bacterium]|nr:hypothetical protein [Planctomycetota bacterium]
MRRESATRFLFPAVWIAASAVAQQSQWQQLAASALPSADGAVTYDSLRDRVVMIATSQPFASPYWSEHWEFDGLVWSQSMLPAALASRAHARTAFDSRRGRLVLFGGIEVPSVQVFLPQDTWILEAGTWQQVAGPRMRFGHGLVYDEARDRVVLVGGQAVLGFHMGTIDETWEFDGATWSMRSPMPQQRAFAGVAYDAGRARTVVYGGHFISGGGPYPLYDALEWDGATWQPLPATGPSPVLEGVSLCHDRERGRCLLYGTVPLSASREVWEYDGVAWSRDPVAPPPSSLGITSMVYDRQRGRLVGVERIFSNGPVVWSRSLPGLAVAQPYGLACGAPPMRSVVDPGARPLLGANLGVDIEGVPNGAAFMCFGWSNRQALGLTLPMVMDGFGLPGCWLLQSDDAITLPCAMTGPTTARFTLPIPSAASFAGLRFFLQPWGPAPGHNLGGGVVGDAVAVTLGSF